MTAALAVFCSGAWADDPERVAKQPVAPGETRWTGDLQAETADWGIEAGCDTNCRIEHLYGEIAPPEGTSVIASPVGTTYSVHHMVGADHDGGGPQGITCIRIFNPNAPGDDTVAFDAVAETIRPDVLGTVATVTELHLIETGGSRFLQINTSSPSGTDLFPGGQTSQGHPLTDACFAIGLDDALDWEGLDLVAFAVVQFTMNGQVVIGPQEITDLFDDPWDGVLNLTVPGGAGMGINGVHLEIRVEKTIPVPNDSCSNPLTITDGLTAFSNEGATTDGVAHPATCLFNSYPDVGSDVWFRYVATCSGDLTVDLCNSEFDTKFAVYPCTRCPIETEPLGCNDDLCFLQSFADDIPVTQGQCYAIRVGGYFGAQGQGVLRLECDAPVQLGACCVGASCIGNLSQPDCLAQSGQWFINETCPGFLCPGAVPANDQCGNAIRLFTGVPYSGSTVNASGIDMTPEDCAQNDAKDVWHVWTADCTGWATFETCNPPSGFTLDTTLAVFDGCDGEILGCNDDGCGVRSSIGANNNDPFRVVQGETYYLRVSGRLNETGAYQIRVNPCRNACCTGGFPSCRALSAAQCQAGQGDPQNPGTECLGDEDGDGLDDVCAPCPTLTNATLSDGLVGSLPASGTVDARQPHPRSADLPRQGIGSPGELGSNREPILVQVIPRLAGLENCFEVCETVVDPTLGPNSISSVVYLGGISGQYEIVLHHAITAGGVTTINYRGETTRPQVLFTSHPANVSVAAPSPGADAMDVHNLISCCLAGAACNQYSCDLDRSGTKTPLDILTAIDLLRPDGDDEWAEWNNTSRPTNTTCLP